MNGSSVEEDIVKRLMLAAAAAAMFVVPGAGTAMAQTKTIMGEMKTETATVESIERASRSVTLKKSNGEYVTVTIPAEVTKFDAMKVGDKVSVEGSLARDGSPTGNARVVVMVDTGKRLFAGSSQGQ